jgi:hypothetical protein
LITALSSRGHMCAVTSITYRVVMIRLCHALIIVI